MKTRSSSPRGRWAIAFVVASLLVAAPCRAGAAPGDPAPAPGRDTAGYELGWADEFDRDGPPSPANWEFEHGFVRNHEAQWYQEANAVCDSGLLVIEARRERVAVSEQANRGPSFGWSAGRTHAEYTSASLRTRGLHDWLYGRFVMRARVPNVAGAWPAFWTVGHGPWPASGEIDVMECYRGSVLANFVWLGRGGRPRWDASKTPIQQLGAASWADAFHEWRMDWDEDSIELYVDDRLMNSVSLDETVNANSEWDNPFRKPQYLLLNLAIGGDNGGDPSKTPFPVRYEIDYVRVYQQRAESKNKQ
ncbi:MAG: glycoside hydrolase family 16 protein [Lacipirellulaceae bacterium]